MLNKDFKVFGIHIYFQDPMKLLCSPIEPEDSNDRTTEAIPVQTKRPPPRTLITVIDGDKRSKSDPYAYNSDISASNSLFSLQNVILCLICVLIYEMLYGQS